MKPWHFLLALLALQAGNAPATAVRIDGDEWLHPVLRPPTLIDDDRSQTPVFRDTPTAIPIVEGDDWSLPAWSTPLDDRRFYSEEASPADHVNVRVIDISWRQVNPSPARVSPFFQLTPANNPACFENRSATGGGAASGSVGCRHQG